jgi:signal peptidase I
VLRSVFLPAAVVLGTLIALLALALGSGSIHTYRVISASMEPTLRCVDNAGCDGKDDDRVVTLRYLGFSPGRGDLVAFHTPALARVRCGTGPGAAVKRIVGLPGDTWSERAGYVYIDGRRLDEPYVHASQRDDATISPSRVPSGSYLVLGDNRTSSCDSRVWGTVPRKELIGKVVATYWPLDRMTIR